MQIIWYGQSFFQILTQKNKEKVVKILIDPFDEKIGLKPPSLEADILLVTHCFDEKTEVLTNKGWKHFYELIGNEKIATLSKKGYLEYQKPQRVINYRYKGMMYKLQTRYIDLLVTPEHRLFVKRKIKKNYQLISARELMGVYKTFKKNAEWVGKETKYFSLSKHVFSFGWRHKVKKTTSQRKIEMDKFLKFLGFFLSEGYVNKYYVVLSQDPHSPYFKEIVESIEEIGFEPKIFKSEKNKIRINSAQLARFLLPYQKPKKVPSFIKELPSRQINIFLEALFKGDGTFKNGRLLRYYSISKELIDEVQELLLKVGGAGHIKKKSPSAFKEGVKIYGGKIPSYCLTVLWNRLEVRDRHRVLGPMGIFFEGYINYTGSVGCVTVPNGVIYIRRNGKPVWCGNCHYDHNNIKAVSGNPFVIEGPGEYERGGVFIRGIPAFHDNAEGKERGEVTIYTLESEGIKICHLGDLGQKELTDEQLEGIGDIDILMIPVGGVYTISAKETAKIISQIEPKIVIPMHYHIPKLKIKLEGLDRFLKVMGVKSPEILKKFSISQKNLPTEGMKIIVLKP